MRLFTTYCQFLLENSKIYLKKKLCEISVFFVSVHLNCSVENEIELIFAATRHTFDCSVSTFSI